MTSEKPRTAVLYGRVSKLARGDQTRARQRGYAEGKSVDQQLAEMTAQAEREGVTVVGVFRDDGVSASRYARGRSREDWPKVMAALANGEAAELWSWEVSRATRDRPVWAALIGVCQANEIRLCVGGKLHDPNDADDGFILDLLNALAVRESAMTSKRIQRDVRDRAQRGLPHGKIPYGYAREYDPVTRALVRQFPDPETAPVVARLARDVLAGKSLYRLAEQLNADGVPSPEAVRQRRLGAPEAAWLWRPDQVRRVVLSPASAGLRTHRGQVVRDVVAAWEPIIKPEEHTRLVAKLSDPSRLSWTDASTKHLMPGLAICGVCGSPLRRVKNRGYPSYACWGGKGTGCVARKQEWVDTFATEVMIERLSRPDLMTAFVRDDVDDVQRAQGELAAAEAELEMLRRARETEEISLASFIRFEPSVIAKIEDARRRATPAAVPPIVHEVAGPDAAARWEALDISQRREVIRLLGVVRVFRARQGVRRFDPDTMDVLWNHPLPCDANHQNALEHGTTEGATR